MTKVEWYILLWSLQINRYPNNLIFHKLCVSYPWECMKLLKFTFFMNFLGRNTISTHVPSYIWNNGIFWQNNNRHTHLVYLNTNCMSITHQMPRYVSCHLCRTHGLVSFGVDLHQLHTILWNQMIIRNKYCDVTWEQYKKLLHTVCFISLQYTFWVNWAVFVWECDICCVDWLKLH